MKNVLVAYRCALWPPPEAQPHFFNFKAILRKGRDSFPLLAFLALRPLFLGYFLLPFSAQRSLLSTRPAPPPPPTLFEPLVLLLFYISGICVCHKAIVSFVFNIQEYIFLSLRDAQYFPFFLSVFFGKTCLYLLS